MAITLDAVTLAVTLPGGLIWQDEFGWSPLRVETAYSLTGALIVERATAQAGRPITLVGQRQFAWITRAELLNLRTLLAMDEELTLTLHDGRAFRVVPAQDPLEVSLLPRVRDSGPADPSAGAWYVFESLKLICI
jgi:hypothetical protein